MNSEHKPVVVGLFVIGTLALAIATVLVLGSGRFFTNHFPLMLYFPDSVNGLGVGSAVKFKGVPIGRVTRIHIRSDMDTGSSMIPVYIEVDEDALVSRTGKPLDLDQITVVNRLIRRGLRGSLELESLLTGRLYVGLDIYTNLPPVAPAPQTGPYPEIPTISTGLSEFLASLERLDLGALAKRLDKLLDQLSNVLDEVNLNVIHEKVVKLLDSMENLTAGPEVKGAIASIKQTADEARALIADVRTEVRPLAGGVNQATAEAARALSELRQTLEGLKPWVDAGSPVFTELHSTLEEFDRAARSIRLLADSLARNPKSILTGNAAPPVNP